MTGTATILLLDDHALVREMFAERLERDGPNAITRQAILDELAAVQDFDVNGWWGKANFGTTLDISPCFVMLQVQGGEFVRVHPEELRQAYKTAGAEALAAFGEKRAPRFQGR